MRIFESDWWVGENSLWGQLGVESIGPGGITFQGEPDTTIISMPEGIDTNMLMVGALVLVLIVFKK